MKPPPNPNAPFYPWTPPFTYCEEGQEIRDSRGQKIVDIRGWGYLTGKGEALGLSEDEAAQLQDKVGAYICKLMNTEARVREAHLKIWDKDTGKVVGDNGPAPAEKPPAPPCPPGKRCAGDGQR